MTKEEIRQRYAEVAQRIGRLPLYKSLDEVSDNERVDWRRWAADARHVIEMSFGKDSTFFSEMQKAISTEDRDGVPWAAGAVAALFLSGQENYDRGFDTSLDQRISGEIFGDLVNAADTALQGGHKDFAAVVAAAALEDSLKKIGGLHGLNTSGKNLQEVVNLMKSKQILTGGNAKFADGFVKMRNSALHAEWSKITDAEVGALIGFLKPIIAQYLS